MTSRVGRTTVVYFLTQVGTTVSGFLATWFINVRLGPSAFGEYSVALAALFWLNIPANAIGNALNKRLSEGRDQAAFMAAGHAMNLAVHVVIVAAILLFQRQVNVFLGVEVAQYFALLVGARAVFDVTLSSLRGHKQVGTSGIINTFEQVVRSTLHIGALFFLGVGVAGLLAGYVTALLVAAAAGFLLLDGSVGRPEAQHVEKLVAFAKFAWLGALKNKAFSWTDLLVMRGLSLSVVGLAAVTKAQLGIYSVAWTLASALALFSISINKTMFPELSELSTDGNYDRVHHFLNEGLAFTGMLLVPGVFGAYVVGDTLLTVFGPEYAIGRRILVILVGARLFAAFGEYLINAINAIDHPEIAFRVSLAYIGLNVVLNVFLVAVFGWYGAAIATALASLCSILLAGYGLTTLIGRPDVPVGELSKQLVAALLMFGVVLALDGALPETLPWVLAIVGVGAAFYGAVLVTLSPRVRGKALSLTGR
ncbi:lipopolysaccharide biosynthesis protein [Haloarcula laminariae]|uniref:lipopolysaccharide biosynthesis protein n=1 Tax=Haloarcula laminariae TaxID=2961577 RepID=UPI00240596EA|nr:polysaccharide biosynthesis C-terminal domain-containing protein [Halomicroarcula sp. FL173]